MHKLEFHAVLPLSKLEFHAILALLNRNFKILVFRGVFLYVRRRHMMTTTPIEILSLIQDLTEEQLYRLKQFILSMEKSRFRA